MVRQVRMVGEETIIEEVEVVRRVPTLDFLENLEAHPKMFIGIMPKTAHYVLSDQTEGQHRFKVLAELPPGVRNLRMRNSRFDLAIPWTYFLYDFYSHSNNPTMDNRWSPGETRVFWASERVISPRSLLRTALIANCDINGVICYGSTGVDATLPLGPRIDRLTQEFYVSTFMHDSGTGTPWMSETHERNWARWRQETERMGAAAAMAFPEWTQGVGALGEGGMASMTVQDVMFGNVDPITLHDMDTPVVIPDLPQEFTFQRAEEWLMQPGITAVNRHRLFVALQNQQADNPAAVEVPVITPEQQATEHQYEVGGMPLREGEARV